MTRTSDNSRLSAGAASRGWQYAPDGENLQLPGRWKWSLRIDHPFSHHGHGTGLDRRTPVRDVLSGMTPAGRPFWAFWFPYTAGHQHGTFVTRSVAFVHAAMPLPEASALRRASLGTRPLMSKVNERAGRQAWQWPASDAQAQVRARQFGWPAGSAEFLQHYLVRAGDLEAAQWLAGPATQERLLAHQEPPISLTTNGADILAWSDYGGTHLSRVEDYDIALVEAMLGVLDTVGRP